QVRGSCLGAATCAGKRIPELGLEVSGPERVDWREIEGKTVQSRRAIEGESFKGPDRPRGRMHRGAVGVTAGPVMEGQGFRIRPERRLHRLRDSQMMICNGVRWKPREHCLPDVVVVGLDAL